MAGVLTLSRALAAGGTVIWEPMDRPRLRVPPEWAEGLRRDVAEVREVLRRAVIFRRQREEAEAAGRLVAPYFALPEAPAPRLGACISCGARIPDGWRCAPCLVAVYVALGAVPPSGVCG